MHNDDGAPAPWLTSAARHPVFRVLAVIGLAVTIFLLCYGVPGTDYFWPEYRGARIYQAHIDLEVYRLGAEQLLSGADLYGRLPDTWMGVNLPFTYPPIAAALFVPLALLPLPVASLAHTIFTLLAAVLVVVVVLRELTRTSWADAMWLGFALSSILLWVGPVRETVGFGQVNTILMALVVVDIIVGRGKKWQGCLIGLAMAIKLTPAVFLAYFLMRKDWRALITGVVSALAYTAIGFLINWRDSVTYWTETLRSADRIGNLAFVSNQSLNGLVRRLVLDDRAASVIWFLLCAVIGLSLLWLMARLFHQGADAAAMCVMGVYSLLASPVSWSHHWVWCIPMLMVLVWLVFHGTETTRWFAAAAAVLGCWVFFSRVIWEQPITQEDIAPWNVAQQFFGNAQTLWGLLFLAVLAVEVWSRRRSAPVGSGA